MSPSSNELARKHPAIFLIFDLLVSDEGETLVNHLLKDRRSQLEAFADIYSSSSARIQLTPVTTDLCVAQVWFDLVGESLEGVIAKRLDRPYDSGGRSAVVRVKKRQSVGAFIGFALPLAAASEPVCIADSMTRQTFQRNAEE